MSSLLETSLDLFLEEEEAMLITNLYWQSIWTKNVNEIDNRRWNHSYTREELEAFNRRLSKLDQVVLVKCPRKDGGCIA